VLEAEEYFSPGQKGSSAMPHKRNPILTENLTGLARVVRSAVTPALENVALWHERDISHSSVERYIGPDATITLDFALARLTGVIDKLLVYPERMQKNLDRMGGLVNSQRVLLALTQAGMAREAAYQAVQRNAMRVWQEGADFLARSMARGELAYVPDTAADVVTERPDWVTFWGAGSGMNSTAMTTAARQGFPRDKMVYVTFGGAEEDMVPAGDAAKGTFVTSNHGEDPDNIFFEVRLEVQVPKSKEVPRRAMRQFPGHLSKWPV